MKKVQSTWHTKTLTVGGERFIADPLRSCGPILLWRRIGSPPPGVPPGDDAHEGAMRIFGVIRVLSDRRRFGNAFETRKKLLSGDDGDPPNHHPPSTPEPVAIENSNQILKSAVLRCQSENCQIFFELCYGLKN